MAHLFVETGGDFSALTYKTVASVESTSNPISTSAWVSVNNVTQTQEITPTAAGDCEGIVLLLQNGRPYYQQTPAASYDYQGTYTVTLQEFTGGAWVNRAWASITGQDVNGTLGVPCTAAYVYFKFGTPYPITTDAGVWRFTVYGTSGQSYTGWVYKATGLVHALVISTPATFVSGDSLWLARGQTIVIDQDVILSTLWTGTDCALRWQNPPAAPYTFTASLLGLSQGGLVEIGTEAAPIPVAQRATWNVTSWVLATTAYWCFTGLRVQFNGAEPAGEWAARLAQDITAGGNSALLDRTVEGDWQVGDVVWIFGMRDTVTRSTPGIARTLTGVSGSTITWTGGSDASPFYTGGDVVNRSKGDQCGIKLTSAVNVEPIEFRAVGIDATNGCSLYGSVAWFTRAPYLALYSPPFMRSVLCGALVSSQAPCHMHCGADPLMGAVFRGAHMSKCLSTNGNVATYWDFPPGCSVTMSDCVLVNAGFGNGIFNLSVYDSEVTDVRFYSRAGSLLGEYVNLGGAASTFTRLISFGLSIGLVLNGFNQEFVDLKIGRASSVGVRFGSGIFRFDNARFGEIGGANLVDIENQYGYYQALFEGGSSFTLEAGGISNAIPGSYVRSISYADVTGDDRGLWKYGSTQRTGDGLTDTTVHTSGTGKYALRFEPTSSANNLEWTFPTPCGNVLGQTMTVAVWVKINSATFYAGTHQKPRLTVRYDNATDVYAEAVESTDWQLLSVTFTPTTSYGQLTVTVSGRTDATGSDAYFYADDFAVLYPAGYKLDLGGLDLWADALPITPPIATVLSANDVWTAATSGLTGVGTVGKLVLDALDAAISSRAEAGDAMTLTAAYDRAKTALAVSEYTAPDSAAAIADAVLDEPVMGHTGWLTKLLSVAKFLGLK